jgi:surfactin synthase thioesterase subunit
MKGSSMSFEQIKLICFPFAGGSSYSYQRFEKYLPNNIKIVNAELPGRGRRMDEPLEKDIRKMAADVFHAIKPFLNSPYAIYGHSMGALLGYLVAQLIYNEGFPLPIGLFVSGRGGPSLIERKERRYDLPQPEFFSVLKELGGCPEEILADEVMMEFFEPIIRADFEAVETFKYQPENPLHLPVEAMIGRSEDITEHEARLWEKETTGTFNLTYFEGDHFFIYQHEHEIINMIIKKLNHHESRQISLLEA